MNPDEKIFEAAAALSGAERAGYLDNACAGQPEMRERIAELLCSHEAAGFMKDHSRGGCGFPPPLDSEDTGIFASVPAGQCGDRIGRYRLLQQIGEGGFGVVWKAEQVEPVTRRVALKIIKAGMDTKEVIARFEAERQALAMMDHPNIAKVFDAGATESGRPYFVMELVSGIPITRFCDGQRLTNRQRLELFAEVCSALNHAHQKGIIHRDIKPSNVMVTLHGDKPVPKVIDFGIAKATQGRLTDRTFFTRFDQFVGTPAYMSPEQAALSGLDVDTRSDIYSLGILLYELLTGKPPFDAKSLMSAGFEEMRRIIREVEPPRPSSRLNTATGAERNALACARRVTPEKLHRTVEPDLDWIVMKAIEKDRRRRYETANGLALDIQRFLTDEPVSATPPTTGYRLRKFARRNKVALWAAAGVAAALTAAALLGTGHTAGLAAILIATTTLSTMLAVRAMQAERLANQRTFGEKSAREEAEAVSSFFTGAFHSPDPARDGSGITVAEMLERATRKLETDSEIHPGRQAVLQNLIGRRYHALGLFREAIPLLEKARDYMQRTFGTKHRNSLHVMRDLALSYQAAGRWPEAVRLQEGLLKMNRKLNGPEHSDTLESLGHLAESYYRSDRPGKALGMRKTLLNLLHRVHGAKHPLTISASCKVAESYTEIGDLTDDALKLAESNLALSRETLGAEHPETLFAIHVLAHCLEDSGSWKEALKLREEEAALRQKVYGRDHSASIHSLSDLARCHYNTGRIDEGLALQDEALLRSRRILGSEHPHTALAAIEGAYLRVSAGRREQALHLLAEVNSRPAGTTRDLLEIAALQAWLSLDSAHAATCRRIYGKASESDESVAAERAAMACCLRPQNDPQMISSALKFARRAVDMGRNDPDLPWYHLAHGMAEFRHGNYSAADGALTAAERGATKLKMARERAHVEITAGLYRFMNRFHQRGGDVTRDLLAKAETHMKPLPVDGQPYPGVITGDDLILWLACKEARSLLKQNHPRVSKRMISRPSLRRR